MVRQAERRTPLLLIGDGGHGQVVADIVGSCGDYRIAAIADDKFSRVSRRNGLYVGPISMARSLLGLNKDMKAIIAIGDNKTRRLVADRLGLPPERYAVLVHSGAHVSPSAVVAGGTVCMPGAVVNAAAHIGAHAIVNSGAIVEHDAVVGSFAHLSPKAAIAGGVRIGEGAQLGIGAVAIPSVRIGAWSVLGAGGAAVRDIPAGAVAVGVPARIIRQAGEADLMERTYSNETGVTNHAG